MAELLEVQVEHGSMETRGKLSLIIRQFYPRQINMGDGIGGPVVRCISGNAFELDVTHYRKDNQEQYRRIEKIIIGKIDNPENPEYKDTTQEDLELALKGKFVSCNVQYRDENTDALVCNVFVQKPPEGF